MRLICCHVKQVSQLSTVQTLLVWHVSARRRRCQCVQQAQCDLAVLLLTTTSADERSPAAAVVIHSRVLMMNCDCQPATQHDHVVSFSSWRRHWMTEARDAMEADQFAYQLAEELKQIVPQINQILSNSPLTPSKKLTHYTTVMAWMIINNKGYDIFW